MKKCFPRIYSDDMRILIN